MSKTITTIKWNAGKWMAAAVFGVGVGLALSASAEAQLRVQINGSTGPAK